MNDVVEQVLKTTLVSNLVAMAYEPEKYELTEQEQAHLRDLAHKIGRDTASDGELIEAITLLGNTDF